MGVLAARLAADLATAKLAADLREADSLLYGLTTFTGGTNYYATQSGGGEAGVGTGFGFATLFQLTTINGATNNPLAARDSGAAGWLQYFGSNGILVLGIANSAPAFITSPSRQFVSTDIGKVFLAIGLHSGSFVRQYVDRDERGSGTAISGYTAANTIHQIAKSGAFVGNLSLWPILAHATFRGVPTLAQIQDYYDRARQLGDLPDIIQGATVTHHWSARRTLVGTVPVGGQAAPAVVADNVTGAAADVQSKQGSPTVVVIDPSVDGRKTYGVQGWTATDRYETAAGAGLAGSASGHWGAWYGRLDALSVTTGAAIFETFNVAGQGWRLSGGGNYNPIHFAEINGTGSLVTSASFVPTTADVMVPLILIPVRTAGALQLWVKRPGQALVQVGSDVAIVGYTGSGTLKTAFGTRPDGNFPSSNTSHFGGSGGNGVPTFAQLTQLANDIERSGRIQAIPGLTDHLWDFTADVLASGQEAVPATVLDRIGMDHLTRQGIDVRTDANSIRGVGPYGVADFWQTALGTGIQGANTGFHVVLDVWLTKVPTTNECLVQCGATNATSGYFLQLLSAALTGTVAGVANTSAYTITASDLNKRLRLLFQKTATVVQLWLNGVQVGSDVAAASYTAPSAASMLVAQFVGTTNGPRPFGSGYIEAVEGGNTILTAGEITTVNADLTAPPPVIAGKTQKRWIWEQDIAAANGALPRLAVERISGGDDLERIGSPLQLAQRVERVWSYETSPIQYGANSFTGANHYSVAGGIVGSAAGFWAACLLRIDSQSGSRPRMVVAKRVDTIGWQFYTGGTNTALQTAIGSATNIYVSPTVVIGAGDVGKLQLAVLVYDVAKLRVFWKRGEQGSGTTTATAFQADTCPMRIGRSDSVAGADFYSADGVTVFGVSGGVGIPTLAEIQALHDLVMATEDIAGIPNKTDHLYSLKRDVLAAGGSLPAQLTDRIGTDHMTKAGSPTLAPQYARAWGW